jgi:acyl-CoA reductase-like NAD-dependent aldehyde dehydrogenase
MAAHGAATGDGGHDPVSVLAELARRGMVVGDERLTHGAAGTYPHRNPATGRVQADVVLADAEQIDRAVQVARRALTSWRRMPLMARTAVLHRLADLLAERATECDLLSALENGTPAAKLGSARFASWWTRYQAGWVDRLEGQTLPSLLGRGLDYVVPEPVGVVGVFVPWNGSLMGMGMSAAAALAAGNTVVVKPPELAPFGALRYAEMALEAGLPPGVLNVLPGDAVAGRALAAHPDVDKICFTGGGAAAAEVMRAAAGSATGVVLELGGKSANIVFADADLDRAVPFAAQAATLLSGQGCALPTRLFVHEDVYHEVLERVTATVRAAVVGDPLHPDTDVGPVISEGALERILGVVGRAVADGSGRLVTGGTRSGGALAPGYFVEPTVFADVDHGSELAQEEIFGPVLSVFGFRDEDEVVALANDSRYGLAAYVHTNDVTRAHRVAGRLEAGSVSINGAQGLSPNAPFGGVRQSGFGRLGGRAGIEEFVRWKNVYVALS